MVSCGYFDGGNRWFWVSVAFFLDRNRLLWMV